MSLLPYPRAEAAELGPKITARKDEALRDFIANVRRLEKPIAKDLPRRLDRIPNVSLCRFRTSGRAAPRGTDVCVHQ